MGQAQIHIGVENEIERFKTKANVAYQVNNLKQWREKFREEKIEFFDSAPFPFAEAFEFRDPFGNRVELIQYF